MKSRLLKLAKYLSSKEMYEEAAQIKKIAKEMSDMSLEQFLEEINYLNDWRHHGGEGGVIEDAIEDGFEPASSDAWGLFMSRNLNAGPMVWVGRNNGLKFYSAIDATRGIVKWLGDMSFEEFLSNKLHLTASDAVVALHNLHLTGTWMDAGFGRYFGTGKPPAGDPVGIARAERRARFMAQKKKRRDDSGGGLESI